MHNFDEFRKRFKDEFWGPQVQDSLRKELEFGKFEPKTKTKMSDYFLNIVALVKDLEPKLTEGMIIDKLIHHFPTDVKRYLVMERIQNIQEMYNVLKMVDGKNIFESEPEGHKFKDMNKGKFFNEKSKQSSKMNSKNEAGKSPVPSTKMSGRQIPN